MTLPGLIYAEYSAPPLVIGNDPGWSPLVMWWVDWTGTRWELSDESSGLIVRKGVRGLGSPRYEHHRDDYAAIAGSFWRDARALTREIFLPLYLFSDGGSVHWVARDRAFWRGMDPYKTGTLYVQAPDGQVRSIAARYRAGGEEAFEQDPTFFGWANYGVYLDADTPFWAGTPIPQTWENGDPVPFFGAGNVSGLGPPFGIAKSTTSGTSAMANPGDEEVYPVWTVTGTAALSGGYSVQIGVDGHVIKVPFALDDDVLVIDTTPSRQSATLNGTDDVMADLETFDFAPIPAGGTAELEIIITAGSDAVVLAEITPLYRRAF